MLSLFTFFTLMTTFFFCLFFFFFFQAEDGIRDLVRSRGLGDVYKRQYQRRVRGDFDAGNVSAWETLVAQSAPPPSPCRSTQRAARWCFLRSWVSNSSLLESAWSIGGRDADRNQKPSDSATARRYHSYTLHWVW
eukprot:TRINITY_DN834_c0_g1_i1.p2 TRINITY_DN834_c0_g1~~TRINITY_DN834_c0_g1_i1.p2  ORF type:complete len:135 (-),score=32.99 TRINITY_DN834_c0_g1_i1:418-822(-)